MKNERLEGGRQHRRGQPEAGFGIHTHTAQKRNGSSYTQRRPMFRQINESSRRRVIFSGFSQGGCRCRRRARFFILLQRNLLHHVAAEARHWRWWREGGTPPSLPLLSRSQQQQRIVVVVFVPVHIVVAAVVGIVVTVYICGGGWKDDLLLRSLLLLLPLGPKGAVPSSLQKTLTNPRVCCSGFRIFLQ